VIPMHCKSEVTPRSPVGAVDQFPGTSRSSTVGHSVALETAHLPSGPEIWTMQWK